MPSSLHPCNRDTILTMHLNDQMHIHTDVTLTLGGLNMTLLPEIVSDLNASLKYNKKKYVS